MDTFKKVLGEKGYRIEKEDKSFVQAYFSKVFSEELSAVYQENLSHEEKYQNLNRLYQYAKSRDLPKSLSLNLLHEILTLTIKLDAYNEELFKEYLKFPLERNDHLKTEAARAKNRVAQGKYTKWSNCL